MLRVYFEALVDYETRDIEAGIQNMLSGKVDGFNPSFLPPAPLVAKAIRAAMHQRLDTERRTRPALPPPERKDPTPEQKERVRVLMEDFTRRYTSERSEAERAEQRRALHRRTNERFDRDTATYSTFNAADDDDYDMGQVASA